MNAHVRRLGGVWLTALAILSAPAAASADDLAKSVAEARRVIGQMGLKPSALTSANYEVLYVGKKEFAEGRLKLLEAVRANFFGFMQRLSVKVNRDTGKLLVIVFDTPKQMSDFFKVTSPKRKAPPDELRGYYVTDSNWAVFYNQLEAKELKESQRRMSEFERQLNGVPGGPGTLVTVEGPAGKITMTKQQARQEMAAVWAGMIDDVGQHNAAVTQHEGTHQLAFNCGLQKRGATYPFWISEGLACTFEVPAPKGSKDKKIGAARVNTRRLADYRKLQKEGKTRGLKDLLSIRQDATVRADDIDLYAESWAAFAFMFNRHPKELSSYLNYLAARPPKSSDNEYDELAEFQRITGLTVAKLQKEFDAYVKGLK